VAKARRKATEAGQDELTSADAEVQDSPDGNGRDDLVPEGKLVCALTGEFKKDTDQERTVQQLIEQLHREYGVPYEEMERDARLPCYAEDPQTGRIKTKSRSVSLVVYKKGAAREPENVIRAAIVAKPGTNPDAKAIGLLDEVIGSLSDQHPQVFGAWTNGEQLAFRMRTYERRTGQPIFTDLTDIPGPTETLEDLQTGTRRPLRIASGDSLLHTFKRCHDYLYGNQSMRPDRAFWQLLFLIFCKIHDEQQSRRLFFVGATEANTDEGRTKVARRIRALFEQVQRDTYKDVFDGSERIELNDRALAYIAGDLGRYSLLNTDTDAKGTAYEAITSHTLKRERGQFFTPRNIIKMMVDMVDPKPGQKILDPACGSGGFLIVALNHLRRHYLKKTGGHPDVPVPSELKRAESLTRSYAQNCLYGIDIDSELRKAARMNMVMNGDGHGNIACFNSLEYGVKERSANEKTRFEVLGGGLGVFDIVFTNPPFGSKIPVSDPVVLETFDLGHYWSRAGDSWQRGAIQ